MAATAVLSEGTTRPHDPQGFSPGSAGGSGFCSFSRIRSRCGPPVVDVWRRRVRDRSGEPGGGWFALCAEHAERAGVRVVWNPDWIIAPGETLKEWMDDNNLRVRSLGAACGRMPEDLVRGVLDGSEPITENIARGLEIGTAIPAKLWLNLERAYRAGLAAGKSRL